MNPENRKSKRPVGQQRPTPPRSARASPADAQRHVPPTDLGTPLPLPHERDQSTAATATEPDPVMAQAKRDIDAGLVDTDMRATPGLDAQRRARLVPGAGGKPPKVDP